MGSIYPHSVYAGLLQWVQSCLLHSELPSSVCWAIIAPSEFNSPVRVIPYLELSSPSLFGSFGFISFCSGSADLRWLISNSDDFSEGVQVVAGFCEKRGEDITDMDSAIRVDRDSKVTIPTKDAFPGKLLKPLPYPPVSAIARNRSKITLFPGHGYTIAKN